MIPDRDLPCPEGDACACGALRGETHATSCRVLRGDVWGYDDGDDARCVPAVYGPGAVDGDGREVPP